MSGPTTPESTPDPTLVQATPGDRDDLAAEVERLWLERDRLRSEAETLDRRVHGGRTRRVLVGVLVVLSCLSFLAASLGFWANRHLLETDIWVDRVGPTIDDPAVQAAMADAITIEVMKLLDPKSLIEDVLPDRARVLATPLASAVRDFVHDRVLTFVSSDRFAELWRTLNERAHRAAVALLRGEGGDVVDTSGGVVTVNIIPVIDAVLARISEVSPNLFGRSIDIPEVTFDDLPDAAREKIGDALGVDLDDDFGVFTLYEEKQLSVAQEAIRAFDRLLPLMIALTVVLTAVALIVSRRRRRTSLQLLVGFALVVVLVRRVALRATDDVLELIKIPTRHDAVEVVLHAFRDPLLASTQWILIGILALIVVLVATGPYPWVVAVRSGVVRLVRGVSARAGDVATQDATVTWIRRNAIALYVAGAAVVVAALWWFDLSWLGLLLLAAAVGGAELVVYRLATGDGDDAGPAGPGAGPPGVTPSTTT
jgi:hypothetical protein